MQSNYYEYKKSLKCDPSIPKVLYFIWITKKGSEQALELCESFFNNAIKIANLVKNTNNGWEIKLVVDQKSISLPKIKILHQQYAFDLINLDKEDLFNTNFNSNQINLNDLDPNDLVNLGNKIIFDSSYNLGIKVDILKYQILKNYGGIVNDFNFIYERLPGDNELQSNSLILYHPEKSKQCFKYIENCFIASTANHEYIMNLQKTVMYSAAMNLRCFKGSFRVIQKSISDHMEKIREENLLLKYSLDILGNYLLRIEKENPQIDVQIKNCAARITVDAIGLSLDALNQEQENNIIFNNINDSGMCYLDKKSMCYESCFGYDPSSIMGNNVNDIKTWVQ